jgi:hypothetical protein
VFMRKHGMILDFECDKVCIKGKVLETVVEGESTFWQIDRYAMWPHPPKGEWLDSGPRAAVKKKRDPDKPGPSSTRVEPLSVQQWKADTYSSYTVPSNTVYRTYTLYRMIRVRGGP